MSLWTITWLVYFASWLAIPHLLLQRKRPAETLAWLWAILLFPYLGIAYFQALNHTKAAVIDDRWPWWDRPISTIVRCA